MTNRDMFYFADIDEKFIEVTKKYGMVNREHNLVKLLEVLYLSDYPELKSYRGLCRDLKDFYFSRRYASDDYELITKEEYEEYLQAFNKLLCELKGIRERELML